MFNYIRKEIEMMKKIMSFFKDEEGATAVEYGIMVAAIAAVIVLVTYAVGGKVLGAFNTVNTAMP
jgi:pilus assembly protein Flp/PilA